jgi:hypothetical protein
MPDIAINPEVLRQRRLKRSAVAALPAAALLALLIFVRVSAGV